MLLQKTNSRVCLFISDNFNLGTGFLIVIHFKMCASELQKLGLLLELIQLLIIILHVSVVQRYAFLDDQLHFLESNSCCKQKHRYFATKGITEKKKKGPAITYLTFCSVLFSMIMT